jgi:hypothetical protein
MQLDIATSKAEYLVRNELFRPEEERRSDEWRGGPAAMCIVFPSLPWQKRIGQKP